MSWLPNHPEQQIFRHRNGAGEWVRSPLFGVEGAAWLAGAIGFGFLVLLAALTSPSFWLGKGKRSAGLVALLACSLLAACASTRPPRIIFTASVRGYECTDRDGRVTRSLPNITVNYATIHHCDPDVCGGASWTCPAVEPASATGHGGRR